MIPKTISAEIFKTHEMDDDFNIVSIINTHAEVEEKFRQFQEAGIDLKECSVVGPENLSGDYVIGYYYVGERIAYWGKYQYFWEGLWRKLNGSGFFMIPRLGTILVAGQFVSAMIRALDGEMIVAGLTGLGAGFYNLGISHHSIPDFEVAIRENRFVIIVHGNATQVSRVKTMLEESAVQERVICL